MSGYLESLSKQLLAGQHGLRLVVEKGEREILVEVALENRKQTVSISLKFHKSAGCHSLRLVSRACPVKDHKTVRAALLANSNLEFGGLCLESSTSPPVMDVFYSLVAEETPFEDVVKALVSVAQFADRIEKRMVGSDVF